MAERLARTLWRSVCREAALWRSFCWLGAPWWRAIGKLLLAGRCGEGAERLGALWQRSIGKKLLAWGAVLGASGLYLNQLRGFCFVVPCQSSK